MTGENTLKLNQETMVEALQTWVDKTFVNPPKVMKVMKVVKQEGQYVEDFEIIVEQKVVK